MLELGAWGLGQEHCAVEVKVVLVGLRLWRPTSIGVVVVVHELDTDLVRIDIEVLGAAILARLVPAQNLAIKLKPSFLLERHNCPQQACLLQAYVFEVYR